MLQVIGFRCIRDVYLCSSICLHTKVLCIIDLYADQDHGCNISLCCCCQSHTYRYDEKEQEIQIGQPTDVKHVAHIGCDGPAVESPSWMKGFDASKESQSGPLDKNGASVDTPEVNWVSEDSSKRRARKDDSSHRSSRSVETARDVPLLPRSTKNRHLSMDNPLHSDSQGKDSSTKTRHRRRHLRGSSETRRRSQDQNAGTGDDSKSDIKKKPSRRSRRSKEESSGEGSTRSSTKSIADESDLGLDDV